MNIRILGLSAAAAILVAGCGTAQQAARAAPASHPAPTVTKTVQAPQPTPTIKITVTQPPAQAPAAPPASSLRDISPNPAVWHLWAGPNTSDAFAINVFQAWDGVPGVKYVYSPVTGQTYAMTYQIVGNSVIATGGDGAFVRF
jgi:hypothetical protein